MGDDGGGSLRARGQGQRTQAYMGAGVGAVDTGTNG